MTHRMTLSAQLYIRILRKQCLSWWAVFQLTQQFLRKGEMNNTSQSFLSNQKKIKINNSKEIAPLQSWQFLFKAGITHIGTECGSITGITPSYGWTSLVAFCLYVRQRYTFFTSTSKWHTWLLVPPHSYLTNVFAVNEQKPWGSFLYGKIWIIFFGPSFIITGYWPQLEAEHGSPQMNSLLQYDKFCVFILFPLMSLSSQASSCFHSIHCIWWIRLQSLEKTLVWTRLQKMA